MGKCVEHSAQALDLVERARRAARGGRFYYGATCGRCGGTQRYALTRDCVTCARRKSRSKVAEKRQARRDEAMAALKRLGLR